MQYIPVNLILQNEKNKLVNNTQNYNKNFQFTKNMCIIKIIIILTIFCILILFTKENLFLFLDLSISNKPDNPNKLDSDFTIKLKSILKVDEILENELMKKHTTFKLGGPAKFLLNQKQLIK